VIIQSPAVAAHIVTGPHDLSDVHDILLMLAVSMAVIASPKTPIDRARTAAKHAQKTAEAYADVVAHLIKQEVSR
jgi:hypothetical protein